MNEIKIGNQVWMKENLDVLFFRNGDKITEARTQEDWVNCGQNGIPAWCRFENNDKNGILYNWHSIIDPRGLSPVGWRIANVVDWRILEEYVNDKENDISLDFLTSKSGGFRGILGGYYGFGCRFEFWTSSVINEDNIYVSLEDGELVERYGSLVEGRCVRCVKEVSE